MKVAGVDLGVRKAAVAILSADGLVELAAYESKAPSRSTQLWDIASWVQSKIEVADAIYVEEPLVGRSTRVSLQIAQTAGAVLSRFPGVPSYLVSNTTWKKAVVGSGNANKVKISEWLDANYPTYSTQCDGDQDCVDATCIAIYGLRTQKLSERIRGYLLPS